MSSKVAGNAVLKSIVLLAMATTIVLGERYTTVQFESYRHEFSSDFYRSVTLQLVNHSNHMVFDGCTVLSRNVEAFDARFESIVPKKGGKSWKLLNVTLDGCKLIENSGTVSKQLLQLLIGSIKSTSPKFPDKCPMEKDKEYCFTNFYLDAVNFPPFFPETKLNFTYTLTYKKLAIFKGMFVVKIQRKGN